MFTDLWEHRIASAKQTAQKLKRDIAKVEAQITGMLDRIVEATSGSVVTAYEKRIHQLEEQKLAMTEEMRNCGKPVRPFEDCFRTAMTFLSNPQKLWRSGDMAGKRLVLRLGFLQKVPYCRREGFRKVGPAVPFQYIQGLSSNPKGENMLFERMAHRGGRK